MGQAGKAAAKTQAGGPGRQWADRQGHHQWRPDPGLPSGPGGHPVSARWTGL